jgi:isopentenyl-diphosphate delta-isomerase
MRNKVILVDKEDNELGLADKQHAHINGLLHRAFSIFIIRESQGDLELLLQQRALTKYHCAGLWSNTCCSHPQPKENLKLSALARLNEELGLKLEDITWVGVHCYKATLSNDLIEHEFDHLFVKVLSEKQVNQLNFSPNPDEVHDVAWVNIKTIKQELTRIPSKYTPWFADTFKQILKYL